ncbi:MAG: phospholipase, partial [Alistipes sp.]|nr:phospholipase [Alistipes sp.]
HRSPPAEARRHGQMFISSLCRAVPVGMLDFERAGEIIEWGYADAMEAMDSIKSRITARRSREQVAERRRAFRQRAPQFVIDRYEVTGLSDAQTAYVHDFIDSHRHRSPADEPEGGMTFDTFRDNYLCLLADGAFDGDYPTVAYSDATGRYGLSIPMRAKPELALMFGGNISSTAFNQAFIGFNHESIGRVAQRGYAELYIGPVYSSGALGGRTTFFLRRPMFIDYSYNFSVLNSMKGNFGNVTDVTNTRKMRQVENFLSLGFGMPLTHKSMLSLTVNGGVNAYRYYEGHDEVDQKTSRTRFLYVAPTLKYERNTFDRRLYPRRGSRIAFSAGYVYGSDRYRRSPIYSGGFGMPALRAVRDWAVAHFEWESYFDIPACKWFSFGFDVEGAVSNHPGFFSAEATAVTSVHYAPTTHSKMVYMPDFYADKFIAAGIMPTFDITHDLMVRASAYAMFRERPTPGAERLNCIADLSVIYNTRLGPVSLSLTKYDFKSAGNMYLTINFGYALFAPHGLGD